MNPKLDADGSAPRISVALCTYNGARFLGEQLSSIARQTRPPWELVVSDDGSTDGTVEIVEKFQREAPFPVHLHRHPANLGVTQNFAAALALCRGDLIALCDQDDFWLPDKLSACAEFLRTHPRCFALFTDAMVVDDDLQAFATGSSLREHVGLSAETLSFLLDPSTSLRMLTQGFFVTGATLVVRQELLGYALPIPKPLPSLMIHDTWLAVVAAALGRLGFLDRPTILYRQHAQQQVGVRSMGINRRTSSSPQTRFRTLAEDHEILYEDLAPRVAGQAIPGSLEYLQRRGNFFRQRVQLPKQRLRRLRPIYDALMRRDYHDFCERPMLSALRDIVY